MRGPCPPRLSSIFQCLKSYFEICEQKADAANCIFTKYWLIHQVPKPQGSAENEVVVKCPYPDFVP